ncbi:integrase repeat-containing protein [Vibrio fluvialis]|uniref:integrase repeat-containing protein n=1 Tax=Vibrio fluvialis TaxID=676 RepID=UPI0023AA12DA|nr:integrase repeat-containing protein [Vibrio fluvialis]MDE5179172.1 integrase repeat-containing protein [Vibrio fluvialis]
MKYSVEYAQRIILLLETKTRAEVAKEMGLTFNQVKYIMREYNILANQHKSEYLSPTVKIHQSDKENIYLLRAFGLTRTDIANKFGISESSVSRITSDFYRDLINLKEKNGFFSYAKAQEIVRCLDIHTMKEYHQKRQLFPRLPSAPDVIYGKEWAGANAFLNTSKKNKSLLSYTEAKNLVNKNSITTCYQYYSTYSKFKGLPFHPPRVYESEWEGWGAFLPKLNIEKNRQTSFLTYTEAKKAARSLKLKGAMEYRYHYKKVHGLPCHPWEYYKKYWKGWADFLGKLSDDSLN